jgi:hypothetical protein
VRFTVACVFDVNFEFSIQKMTLKTHATVKRTSKLHIQNTSASNRPLCQFEVYRKEPHTIQEVMKIVEDMAESIDEDMIQSAVSNV